VNLSNIKLDAIWATAYATLTTVGLQIIGAIVLFIVGRWLINFIVRVVNAGLKRQAFDPIIAGYIGSALQVLLNIVLVISLLGWFGIQTTTFAGLLAAAAFAIGTAWSGLLANFAAGAFIIVLRPFKHGDFISAAGVTGTVDEIGIFATTINTPDNIRTIVGNNKIFSDNIQNFTANPYRRVELMAQLAHEVDPRDAISLLQPALAKIPNVIAAPAPEVTVLTFNSMGPVLAVRPYCHNDHYWQVYFDANMLIRNTFVAANYATPEQPLAIRTTPLASAATR
jgi:small conductance mechanosensitive channel